MVLLQVGTILQQKKKKTFTLEGFKHTFLGRDKKGVTLSGIIINTGHDLYNTGHDLYPPYNII